MLSAETSNPLDTDEHAIQCNTSILPDRHGKGMVVSPAKNLRHERRGLPVHTGRQNGHRVSAEYGRSPRIGVQHASV
jgi:hypothetical protein